MRTNKAKLIGLTVFGSFFLALNTANSLAAGEVAKPVESVAVEAKALDPRIMSEQFAKSLNNEDLTCEGFSEVLGSMIDFYGKKNAVEYEQLINIAQEEYNLQLRNPKWKEEFLRTSIKGTVVKDKLLRALREISR